MLRKASFTQHAFSIFYFRNKLDRTMINVKLFIQWKMYWGLNWSRFSLKYFCNDRYTANKYRVWLNILTFIWTIYVYMCVSNACLFVLQRYYSVYFLWTNTCPFVLQRYYSVYFLWTNTCPFVLQRYYSVYLLWCNTKGQVLVRRKYTE
jgi:hypothetical protein